MPKHRGRDWHAVNHETVPEVTWARLKTNTGKIFFYDNRHNRDHTQAVAYSLSLHNGLCNLFWPGGQLIKKDVPSIIACQKLIRDRLK